VSTWAAAGRVNKNANKQAEMIAAVFQRTDSSFIDSSTGIERVSTQDTDNESPEGQENTSSSNAEENNYRPRRLSREKCKRY
jgi:hypothetical protein